MMRESPFRTTGNSLLVDGGTKTICMSTPSSKIFAGDCAPQRFAMCGVTRFGGR